jgi:hypothetical protein
MKNFLGKMAPVNLRQIASDNGLNPRLPDKVLINALVVYFRAHGIKTADLRTRYPVLANDIGLKG